MPAVLCQAVIHVDQRLATSERRTCKTVGIARSTQGYTREALSVTVQAKMGALDVLEVLYRLILKQGKPEHIRSDNGREFITESLQDWLRKVGIYIATDYPESPCENGYNERFNGILRNDVLNAKGFTSRHKAQTVINTWLKQYNHIKRIRR